MRVSLPKKHGLRFSLVFIVCAAGWAGAAGPQSASVSELQDGASALAATPPMGWNSWDGYGTTVKEADVKANAQWLAEHLKPFGWQYVVVDMEWFVTNPTPEGNSKTSIYSIDPLRTLYAGCEPLSVGGK